MPDAISPFNTDQLELAEDGIWYSRGHQDFGFLSDDDTDWVQIEDASFWYKHRSRIFSEVIRQYPPTGALYEIGAGNGAMSITLQNEGYPIIAVEPTVEWARNAKRRGVQNVICSKIESAGITAGGLSNVGLFDVLEHIPNDAEFLTYVRSLMPLSGRIYCAVPAYNLLWSNEDDYAGHVRRYQLTDLCRKLTSAGFEVEYKNYYFSALIFPIFLLRALPSWLGLRRKRNSGTSQREHNLPDGSMASKLINGLLEKELRSVRQGAQSRWGASCIVVAKAR